MRMLRLITAIILLLNSVAFAADKVFYYHTDPAGTPLAMTDSSGNVVWRAGNRPFGEEQSTSGSMPNDRTFVGKEKDKESGLHYFGARYMKDDIGRFLSVDPVGAVDARTNKVNEKLLLNPQRLNPYAYSLNNPYRYVDADGKFAIPLLIAVGAAILLNDHPANAPALGEVTIARPSGGQELAGEATSAAIGFGAGKIIGKLGSKFFSEGISSSAGRTIGSLDDILANPGLLSGKTPQQVENILSSTTGWKVESLGKGAHKGQGWVLREYNEAGNATGRMIRYHPGGGHHGPEPYWRVNDYNSKSDIIR